MDGREDVEVGNHGVDQGRGDVASARSPGGIHGLRDEVRTELTALRDVAHLIPPPADFVVDNAVASLVSEIRRLRSNLHRLVASECQHGINCTDTAHRAAWSELG